MEDLSFKKVADVLKNYLNTNICANEKLSANLVLSQNWQVIFKELADKVKLLNLKDNKILFVAVKNSSILYNISCNKAKIIESIKESTGLEILDIKVLIR
ncbi:DciA family protein [Borrelia hispanica]|uniref:DciA family protein n=1 Tax=Borrelia hispanica TaxID=40835 RepID=UPI00046511E9|nr:DciA family protein [Borrelia hispanica]